MPDEHICSDCGAKLSPEAQGGLCVRCLFNLGLNAEPGTETATPVVPITEKAGDRIGRYKLLQKIGEGGCGVVYMAEQEEPVRRRVALKVIKLGMDTREVIARFEAERQALAMMDHPNIAKIFDAGVSGVSQSEIGNRKSEIPQGRPYFVMELVRGVKITEYCDQHNLSTHERLDLFIKVCQAIQHAHQKGIIHRDIKPSNILVTVNDGVPVPKVIDFGIAKATEGRLTDKTLFTAFQQFMGTPAYMSPEQAEMTSLDIDTRSDIYSLGVLLYELLTGKTPFDAKELVEAEDLIQEFLSRLVHKEHLKDITVEGGKFRSFLLTLLTRFLANEWNRDNAQKRGGGKTVLSIDDKADDTRYAGEPADPSTPESLYDRRWAMTLLDLVRERLRSEYTSRGEGELFAALRGHLSGAERLVPYAELVASLGKSKGAVKKAVHDLRKRYGKLLRAEIAATVSGPEEEEEEIQHLIAAASR